MNIMNMMWFMGMCLLSTVIIGGFFIHRDNKRNAAANKKRTVFKGRLNDILHYKNYIWVEVRLSTL